MNIKKIVLMIVIFIVIFNLIFPTYSRALDEVLENGDNFLDVSNNTVINEYNLKDTSSNIYKILITIAVVVSIIVGAVLGIQFIFGSVEGKAKISEALVPYIIGCFIVFGAFTIWKVTINIGQNVSGRTTTYSVKYICSCGAPLSALGDKCSNCGNFKKEEDVTKYLICNSCKDELSIREQHNGKCDCGLVIKDI